MPSNSRGSADRGDALRPIFVCGAARSGTTLLTNLLDGHPRLAVFPGETYFYRAILERGWAAAILRVTDLLAMHRTVYRIASRGWRTMIAPTREDMEERLRLWSRAFGSGVDGEFREQIVQVLDGCRLPRGYWRCYLDLYRKLSTLPDEHGQHFVEKTPFNERYVPFMHAEFGENARYVHIVRDPRDVVASWLHRPGVAGADRARKLLDICYVWAASVGHAGLHRARIGTRFILLRYEDLVRDPGPAIAALCRALDLDADPCLSSPTRQGTPQAANTSYPVHQADKRIVSSQVGRHRTALTEDEIAAIEHLLGRQMHAIGYAVGETTLERGALFPDLQRKSLVSRLRFGLRMHRLRALQRRAGPLPFIGTALPAAR